MELRAARLGTRLVPLLALLALLVAVWPAAAGAEPKRPKEYYTPPKGYALTAHRVLKISDRTEKVRTERARKRDLYGVVYTNGPGRWQVSYFQSAGKGKGAKERVQVQILDADGTVLEQWTGVQVPWKMARGYEGQFGRKFNAAYLFIPMCVLFLLPFVDPRRPFRWVHLDLLALLGFAASHIYFNRGEIDVSTPLAYPPMVYLLI